MPVIAQFDFPFNGPFGDSLLAAAKDLAQSIAAEPGLRWKIWTENPQTQESGGIYLFDDLASAEAYVKKHTERLKGMGVSNPRMKLFFVNEALTKLTRGPA